MSGRTINDTNGPKEGHKSSEIKGANKSQKGPKSTENLSLAGSRTERYAKKRDRNIPKKGTETFLKKGQKKHRKFGPEITQKSRETGLARRSPALH
jgi:hypothetical protein